MTQTTQPAMQLQLQLRTSAITDPGRPHKQNQDAFFMLQDAENDALVLGVFDGHGRETGKDAALTAKAFFEAHFRSFTATQYAQLEADPQAVLSRLFRLCHATIKNVFRSIYEQRGYNVHYNQDGSLVRHDHGDVGADDDDDDDGICIRGGTTATVVVVLHGGTKIITANVGDSTALLGTQEPVFSSHDVHACVSGKQDTPAKKNQTVDGLVLRFDDEIKNEFVLLTGDHSADSESEFRRVRRQSCGIEEKQVQFVYDYCDKSSSCSRATRKKRFPVFYISPRGLVQQNMIGDYYKNVRDEWATIVTTPIEAPFPDSLAFTRSLGDFHMHQYGVSFEPTVHAISLEGILSQRKSQVLGSSPSSVAASAATATTLEFFLVVASDGVWDNWKYEDLVEFLVERDASFGMDSDTVNVNRFWPLNPYTSRPLQDQHTHNHVDRLTSALMEANIDRADRIFGEQADNMTAIVCQIRISA